MDRLSRAAMMVLQRGTFAAPGRAQKYRLAILAALLALASGAQSPDPPDRILATKDGEYVLVTPDDVTDAGLARGPASASDVVTINAAGDNVVYATPEFVTAEGLPSRSGEAGNCLKVNTGEGGFEWGACGTGGGGAPLSDATPEAVGTTGAAAGDGTSASRDDHVHQLDSAVSGTVSTLLNLDANGQPVAENDLRVWRTNSSGIPAWRRDLSGEGVPLSDETPIVEGTGAAGDGAAASRDDHVHPANPAPGANATALRAVERRVDSVIDPTGATLADGQTWALSNCTGTGATRTCDTGYAAAGGGAPLSDATPEALGAAASGDGTGASRDDHVHPTTGLRQVSDPSPASTGFVLTRLSTNSYGWRERLETSGTPAALTAAGTLGTASLAARGDHAHPTTGLRLVPDATHVANGDVLQASGGNYAWATPGGDGGGAALELIGTASFTARTDTTQKVIGSGLAEGDMIVGTLWYSALRSSAQTIIARYGDITGFSNRIRLQTPPSFGATVMNVTMSGTDPEGSNSGKLAVTYAGTQPNDSTQAFMFKAWKFAGGGGGGGGTPLSDGTPLAWGTAAAGVGTAASRGDHVHPSRLSTATPLAPNAAGSRGDSLLAARGDHRHPNQFVPALSNANPGRGGGSVGAPGVSDEASRADHLHPSTFVRRVFVAGGDDLASIAQDSWETTITTGNLQTVMRSGLTAYSQFELWVWWATTSGPLCTAQAPCEIFEKIIIAGVPPGRSLDLNDLGIFRSQQGGGAPNVGSQASVDVPTVASGNNAKIGWIFPSGAAPQTVTWALYGSR